MRDDRAGARGEVKSRPYWRYSVEPGEDRGRKHYVDEFSGLLQQAVQRRTCTGRVALLLSGGCDSRAMISFMDDPTRIKAVTFSGRSLETRDPRGDWAVAGGLPCVGRCA